MECREINSTTVTVMGPIGHVYHVLSCAGNVLVIKDCCDQELLTGLLDSLRLDRGGHYPEFPSFEEEFTDLSDAEGLEMVLIELNADFGTIFKPDNGEPSSRRRRPTLVDIVTVQCGHCVKLNEKEVTVLHMQAT